MAAHEDETLPRPVRIFISYSHKDHDLCVQLISHLSPLRRAAIAQPWYDREISAGKAWEAEIVARIEDADIIVLLVSADFFASEFICRVELPMALERQAEGRARVIPVLVRDVAWHDSPLAAFQMLPTDALPVTSWINRDEALASVARAIRVVAIEISTSSLSPGPFPESQLALTPGAWSEESAPGEIEHQDETTPQHAENEKDRSRRFAAQLLRQISEWVTLVSAGHARDADRILASLESATASQARSQVVPISAQEEVLQDLPAFVSVFERLRLSRVCRHAGLYAMARTLCRGLYEDGRGDLPDETARAVLNEVSETYRLEGNYAEALRYALHSIADAGSAPASAELARGYMLAGSACRRLGELTRALEYGDRSIEIGKAAEVSKQVLGTLYWHAGHAYRRTGGFAIAHSYFQRGAELCAIEGDRRGEAIALNNIASTFVSQGEFDRAMPLATHAHDLLAELHDPHRSALCDYTRATAFCGLGDFDAALGCFETCRQTMEIIGDFQTVGYCAIGEGTVHLKRHEYGSALDSAADALSRFQLRASRSLALGLALHQAALGGLSGDPSRLALGLCLLAEQYEREGLDFSYALGLASDAVEAAHGTEYAGGAAALFDRLRATLSNHQS